ncbi:6-phosphofructokinase [Mesomycoplasma ovipneumoniae]|uniref:6-phosphofructokinase n=1 Tax=Mesomycoplasma ovipneumoniae TaxID=29562 RepID=UPI00083E74D4|nr:6-phosphofructokinase [Mesomycoplasma ovipneumoniae]MDW2834404.1 6-phosphofructokinase [Mesomycoplasma ovipneumoniae]WNM13677.1 6-phosphofructokinase [Mesomycoplasma ovipneumoniae]
MSKKIAILTSGGDSPGMNSAISALVKAALNSGFEPYLIFEGYLGILNKNIILASEFPYNGISSFGGTAIGSTRFPEFKEEEIQKKAAKILTDMGISSLIVIGGDGTYKGGYKLHLQGIKVIALPGTIDNDIQFTDYTIGFDSALNTIVESVDKLRDTANSHRRCFVVEVMGRHCPDLALYSAIATGSEIVITNTNRLSAQEASEIVLEQFKKGKPSVIITVLEYVLPNLKEFAAQIEKITNITTRAFEVGHIQRGGRPSAFDRILATKMAMKAIELIDEGKSGLAIGYLDGKIQAHDITKVVSTPVERTNELAQKINKINQN